MTLAELLSLIEPDGVYKLVLYKQDGIFWVRRGECAAKQTSTSRLESLERICHENCDAHILDIIESDDGHYSKLMRIKEYISDSLEQPHADGEPCEQVADTGTQLNTGDCRGWPFANGLSE